MGLRKIIHQNILKMKKIYYLTLAAMLAGAGATGMASAKKFRALASPNAFSAAVAKKQSALTMSSVCNSPKGAALANSEPDAAISNTEGWGLLTGTDGKSWFYYQKFSVDPKRHTYTGSEFSVMNADNETLATIKVDIPDDKNVNVIEPFGSVTKKFFDRDEKTWEVMVFIHSYDASYKQYGEFRVYNQNGEIVRTYDADNALFVDYSEGFNSYQRIALVKAVEEEGVAKTQISVMQPCGWNEAPTVEKTLSVPSTLLNYSAGSYFNSFNIDGNPYFVFSHYEKPFFVDETVDDPIATSDNHFILEVYDKKFNQINTLSVPVAAEQGALYGMRSFGLFSDDASDMCKGTFSGDDKMNFIVTNQNYTVANDDYTYTFEVYNEDSQKIAVINQAVSSWQKLSDIPGKESQYGFIITGGSSEAIEMVNIPSCDVAATFSAMVGDAQLSDNFDRYPVGDEYQYVFGIGNGLYDEQKNVISRIGWFNKDCSVDHFVSFNIGQDGENFTPLVNGTVLNPYLFNTDNLHEYLFLAKIKNQQTGIIATELWVANENGVVLRKFKGDDTKGDMSVCDVLDNRLVVSFANQAKGTSSVDFYNLPFEKFEKGGEGTAASPYKVSTVGDLMMIAQNPSAYYELVNDIDMSNVEWSPIATFSGHFDGKNHKLLNLEPVSSAAHIGLFGQIIGTGETDRAEVKNLSFVKPSITVSAKTRNAGVLAGSAMAVAIDNVHVYGADIYGNSVDAPFGGIVGEASLYSSITSTDIDKLYLDAEQASNVGGLVGNLSTSSTINASSVVNGTIRGLSAVGGIAGTTDSNTSNITNAYYNGSVGGKNTVGGIVGSAGRSLITNCYVNNAELSVSEPNQWTNLVSLGAIAGYLEPDWANANKVIISGNVAGNDCSFIFLDKAENSHKGAHRIIGSTIADDAEAAGKTETGLASNYAAFPLVDAAETSGATTVNGETVTADALTEAFLSGIGFKFGANADSPWVAQTEALPKLYFQNSECVVSLDSHEILMDVDDEYVTLEVEVFGADDITGITFTSSDPETVSVSEPEIEDNYAEITLTALKPGKATITVAFGGQTATCQVIVTGDASVGSIDADALAIRYADGVVTADGAARIDAFSITGALVGSARADRLSVDAKGLLIVVATGADGNRTISKIIAK